MENYQDEMKISIKEIIEDFNYNIKNKSENIAYYEELIEVKKKHRKDVHIEENTLFALRCEKSELENTKTRIEKILYENDIPVQYYKIEEEE